MRNPKRGSTLYLTGFAVPTICLPIAAYEREILEKAFPEFDDLDIDDTLMDNREIDLLIGSDYYWSIIEDEHRRCDTEGLVAVKSKLGWVLSGPLKHEKNDNRSTVEVVSQNMLLSLQENHDDTDKLSVQVEKFWEMETLGIRDKETSACDRCIEDIKVVNDRYEVRNPFKEDHPMIEDNYALALARLMNLKNKLDETPVVLMQYNER